MDLHHPIQGAYSSHNQVTLHHPIQGAYSSHNQVTSHFEDAMEVDRLKREMDGLHKTIKALKRELKAANSTKNPLEDLRSSVINFKISV